MKIPAFDCEPISGFLKNEGSFRSYNKVSSHVQSNMTDPDLQGLAICDASSTNSCFAQLFVRSNPCGTEAVVLLSRLWDSRLVRSETCSLRSQRGHGQQVGIGVVPAFTSLTKGA